MLSHATYHIAAHLSRLLFVSYLIPLYSFNPHQRRSNIRTGTAAWWPITLVSLLGFFRLCPHHGKRHVAFDYDRIPVFQILWHILSVSTFLHDRMSHFMAHRIFFLIPHGSYMELPSTQNCFSIQYNTVQGLTSRAWRLNCGHACAFGRVDEAVSGGKPPAGKGVVGMLSWHGSHFWVCITFCKVRHGDSVAKPDYYYYFFPTISICFWLNPLSHPLTLHILNRFWLMMKNFMHAWYLIVFWD